MGVGDRDLIGLKRKGSRLRSDEGEGEVSAPLNSNPEREKWKQGAQEMQR